MNRTGLLNNKILFIFIALGFLAACAVGIEERRKPIPPKPFVKELWQSLDTMDIRWAERPAMARDLINKNILVGKSRAEITELLGEPNFDSPPEIEYELEQIFGSIEPIAFENLKLVFNEAEKVEKAEIKLVKVKD